MSDWVGWPGRIWRVLATAVAFVGFGIGGLLLGTVMLPVLSVLARAPERRGRWARALVAGLFRLLLGSMRLLGLITYEFHGLERLRRRGLLVLANHPTLIDVVFLIAYVPDAICVVKAALARHPCTRGPVLATGYICNSSGPDLPEECLRQVKAGGNLIIFPEGTRTRPGEGLRMHRGAAHVALRGGLAITPVRIACRPLALYKGQPWWQVARHPLHFTFRVGEDLSTTAFQPAWSGDVSLAARRLTEFLVEYFSESESQPHQPDEYEWAVRHASAAK